MTWDELQFYKSAISACQKDGTRVAQGDAAPSGDDDDDDPLAYRNLCAANMAQNLPTPKGPPISYGPAAAGHPSWTPAHWPAPCSPISSQRTLSPAFSYSSLLDSPSRSRSRSRSRGYTTPPQSQRVHMPARSAVADRLILHDDDDDVSCGVIGTLHFLCLFNNTFLRCAVLPFHVHLF